MCWKLYSHLSSVWRPGSQSEVANFHLHILGEEHVAEFEVPVDDALAVGVRHPCGQLTNVVAHFDLRQGRPVPQHVHQRLGGGWD